MIVFYPITVYITLKIRHVDSTAVYGIGGEESSVDGCRQEGVRESKLSSCCWEKVGRNLGRKKWVGVGQHGEGAGQ